MHMESKLVLKKHRYESKYRELLLNHSNNAHNSPMGSLMISK